MSEREDPLPADYQHAATYEDGTLRPTPMRDHVATGLTAVAGGLATVAGCEVVQLGKAGVDLVSSHANRVEAHASPDAVTNAPPAIRINPSLPPKEKFNPLRAVDKNSETTNRER